MRLSRFQLAGALVAFAAVAALAVFLIWPSMLLSNEGVVAWPSPAKTPAAAQRLAMQASASAQAAASSASGDALPAMGFRHMANALGQERDLYAWYHRMLKQEPPSAAQVALMRKVVGGCQEVYSSPSSRRHLSQALFAELQFRCAGFSEAFLRMASGQVAPVIRQFIHAASTAEREGRCEDAWAFEQQYEWLPNSTTSCLHPHKDGKVSTIFGSQYNVERDLAFFLEISTSEWGARDGMAPSQIHTMQLLVCAETGMACGSPSDQMARIKNESEGGYPFPMSEIERMRPLIREYLRHPDLSVTGSAPEQLRPFNRNWNKRKKP